MKILLGYISVFAYVFAMIFGLGPIMSKKANTETSRKVIHTSLFMVWVFIDLFFKNSVHQIILPVVFTVLNALSYKFKLYSGVEREDENHPGTIYFAIAVTAVMTVAYFLPQTFVYTGAACFCLTFGDGFAALAGYNLKSPKVRGNKSLIGFGACFAASAFALVVFKMIYMKSLTIGDAFLLAAVSAITELCGHGLDNFSVTFSVFAVSMLLGTTEASVTLLCAVLIFLIVFFTKAITYFGALAACAMVIAFGCCAGYAGLAFFIGCYFIIFAAGLVKGRIKSKSVKKHEGRGLKQVLINGSLGTLCVILYGITGGKWLLAAAVVSIGGNFIDSVSSDVGCLAKKMPYDFIRKQYVATGLSGGVSMLGTGAALVCSVLISVFMNIAFGLSVWVSVMGFILVFGQTVLDSVLGSAIQLKNVCPVCDEVTEKSEHCGVKTEYLRGVKCVDNNTVNLISSVLITALACAVFAIIA